MITSAALISFHDVVLAYDQVPILQHVNLEIKQHDWLVVLGRNGSGKSSLIKAMLGILPPLAGRITRNHAILGEHNQFVGYVPQEHATALPPLMSARSLLMNSLDPLDDYRYSRAANWHIIDTLVTKLGFTTQLLDQPFHCLSGGQKKSMYLAQALLRTPQLLLLDEPLVNLDLQSRQIFMQALRKISPELTVVMVSHDLRFSPAFRYFIHVTDRTTHVCTPQVLAKKHYAR